MIDSIANRYGCLPSKVLAEGDVFDIFVIETIWSYQQYIDDKDKLQKGELPSNPHILKDMVDRVKGEKDARKNS